MNLMYDISFKVISTTSFSKLAYMFKRVFIRMENRFMLYFFIALILAVLITFFYYRYISRLLKIEELKVLKLLKRVFRPVFRFRKRKYEVLVEHEVFTKKQLKKRKKRKGMFDVFGKKTKKVEEVKKEEKPVKEVEEVKEEEEYKEEEYIMWPPKPKEGGERKKKVFDELSKLK